MSDEILTLKDVAEHLKVTEKTIYRLLNEDKIPAFKVGGSWRFKKSQIDEWIESKLNEQSIKK